VSDGVVFNHLGQCVTDLERSKRFYCELLGFTFDREINPPDEMSAALMSLEPPLAMTACYLVRDGLTLELLYFAAEGQTRPYRARTMNEPGLTHISLSVDDIDSTLARVVEFGGEAVAGSNIGAAAFIRDPDGQLVELLPMAYRRQFDSS
jgi:catechol 2,3-dioxygenase-like lactoylglutathione lyase family enzyme